MNSVHTIYGFNSFPPSLPPSTRCKGKSFVVGLRVGPRLMVRTATRMGRGVMPETEYSVEDRTLVVGVRKRERGREGGVRGVQEGRQPCRC